MEFYLGDHSNTGSTMYRPWISQIVWSNAVCTTVQMLYVGGAACGVATICNIRAHVRGGLEPRFCMNVFQSSAGAFLTQQLKTPALLYVIALCG